MIVDVRLGVEGIPTTAYRTADEVEGDGKEIQTVFKHVPSSIGALEAEEVSGTLLLHCMWLSNHLTLASRWALSTCFAISMILAFLP